MSKNVKINQKQDPKIAVLRRLKQKVFHGYLFFPNKKKVSKKISTEFLFKKTDDYDKWRQ